MVDERNLSWGIPRLIAIIMTAGVAILASSAAAQTAPQPQVTYSKDIAPILQRSCQNCHRPDSIAPMSLLTYQQVRPWARAIKTRTHLRNVPSSRGAMPPWFIEKNIGIQQFKDDISLTDAELAKIAAWADNGAPEGDPRDLPPALQFASADTWALGQPDLIVASPPVFVKGIASDWWGPVGQTPTGMTEDRYAASAEVKETSDLKKSALGSAAGTGKTSLFVFHHANVNVVDPAAGPRGGGGRARQASSEVIDDEGGGGLTLHEVGRNGDVFPAEAGKPVRAGAVMTFNAHMHAPGVRGADQNARLNVGLKFHPRGYKPKFRIGDVTFGRTEIDMDGGQNNQRFDAYWLAEEPIKLLNFEPHLHATGVRMCIEAIHSGVIETLNCSGYDHNWVKNYLYDENSAPILPKGTILHAISWFDNSPKNANNVDPRNPATYGARSVSNMFVVFNKAFFLTEQQYQEELKKRREYLNSTGGVAIGCPGCWQTPPPQGATGADQ
jgi:hypothetical protein